MTPTYVCLLTARGFCAWKGVHAERCKSTRRSRRHAAHQTELSRDTGAAESHNYKPRRVHDSSYRPTHVHASEYQLFSY